MILFCKNKAVYDIEHNLVLNHSLLPGVMQRNPCLKSFNYWLSTRYSASSNFIAQGLKYTLDCNNYKLIDIDTYALSLSDCYWLKDNNDTINFEDVSPYCRDFWRGVGHFSKGAIPTLYVNGALPKEWQSSQYLFKYGELGVEAEVCNLCSHCGVPANRAFSTSSGVVLQNFTDTTVMLEQANQSGYFSDNYTNREIINQFGSFGVQMLTIDAIVGNGDRHTGNFGWLRDADSGAYLRPAPLYDFDHALDDKTDFMIKDLIKTVKFQQFEVQLVLQIAETVSRMSTLGVFRDRAKMLLYSLENTEKRGKYA